MPVREFELFHGAVLAKIVRNEKPITLRMIETKPSSEWAVYRINDEVTLIIKHSKKARSLRQPATATSRTATSWTFVFSSDQLAQVSKGTVWVALVCGQDNVGAGPKEICLLQPDEIDALIPNGPTKQQSVTVRYEPGKSLRALHGQVTKVVPRNRLDTWQVPGS